MSHSKIPVGLVIILIIASLLSSCKKYPIVTFYTGMGDFDVVLFTDRAPVTTGNFLRYVDSGLYRDCSFYRIVNMENQPSDSVKIEVIQGGMRNSGKKGFQAIRHESTDETGLKHEDGTISMARSKPGTATSEFFICVGDQPELDRGGHRNPDGEGFAAFGKVITGRKVVYDIHNLPAEGQYIDTPVTIFAIERK